MDLLDDERGNAKEQVLACIGLECIRTELVLERAKAKVVNHYRKVYADRKIEQKTSSCRGCGQKVGLREQGDD